MRLLFTSYSGAPEYTDPQAWLQRIRGYTGILESLAKTDTVIAIERISYEGYLVQNGVQYHFLDLGKKVRRFPFRLHRLIRSLQPDAVFINGFIFPLQILQLRRMLGPDVPILILHRAETPAKGIRKKLQQLADRCVDAYLFTSSGQAEEWLRDGIIAYSGKIYEVIQASSRFRPEESAVRRPAPVFLWVGNLIPRKDPLTVLRAFHRYRMMKPESILYLIYQTSELMPVLMNWILTNEGAEEGIRFIGPVAHEQLGDWYNQADYFISASRAEGSGVAVSEAMSCGCIPIVSDIPSHRKMTAEGTCGFLFEKGNEDALYQALLATLHEPITETKEKILRQFEAELSFDAIAGKIRAILPGLEKQHVSKAILGVSGFINDIPGSEQDGRKQVLQYEQKTH